MFWLWLSLSFLAVGVVFVCTDCLCSCDIWDDSMVSNQIATGYTTYGGTFSQSLGTYTTTSDGAILIATAAGDTDSGHVTVVGKASATGAKLRVFFAWQDEDNHAYWELTVGPTTGTKLFRVEAGVATELKSIAATIAANTNFTMACRWDGVHVFCSGGTSTFFPCEATGSRVGLGGDANGGTLTFESIVYTYAHPARSSCNFVQPANYSFGGVSGYWVEDRKQPTIVQLDVVGVTGPGTCAADHNTTYLLPLLIAGSFTGQDYGFSPGFGTTAKLTTNSIFGFVDEVGGAVTGGQFTFSGSVPSPYDGYTMRSVTMTNGTGINTPTCDWSAATLTYSGTD